MRIMCGKSPDESLMATIRSQHSLNRCTVGTSIGLDQRLEAERGVNEFQHYFAEQFEKRRTAPEDDILTNLLNARIDDDDDE